MRRLLGFAFVLGSAPALAQTPAAAPAPAAPAPAAATAPAAPAPAAATAPAAPAPAAAAEPAPAGPPPVAEPAAAPASAPPVQPVTQVPPSEEPVSENYSEGELTEDGPDRTQAQFFLGGAWDMTLPVGSSSSFIDVFSVQGASFQARYQGLGNIGIGVMAAWHNWSSKSDQTFVADNVTIGGTQARGMAVNPMYLRLQYSLFDMRSEGAEKSPVPYVAMHVGGARTQRRVDMGVWTFYEDSWHWAFAPELGVEVPIDKLVVMASGRFNYIFASGEGPEQLYFNFSLGLGAF